MRMGINEFEINIKDITSINLIIPIKILIGGRIIKGSVNATLNANSMDYGIDEE